LGRRGESVDMDPPPIRQSGGGLPLRRGTKFRRKYELSSLFRSRGLTKKVKVQGKNQRGTAKT